MLGFHLLPPYYYQVLFGGEAHVEALPDLDMDYLYKALLDFFRV